MWASASTVLRFFPSVLSSVSARYAFHAAVATARRRISYVSLSAVKIASPIGLSVWSLRPPIMPAVAACVFVINIPAAMTGPHFYKICPYAAFPARKRRFPASAKGAVAIIHRLCVRHSISSIFRVHLQPSTRWPSTFQIRPSDLEGTGNHRRSYSRPIRRGAASRCRVDIEAHR